MKVLRIRNWHQHFENNRTKEIRSLTWVPFPNKHDGEGYTELVSEHENGPAHYGAWCVIAQVASKCEPRGTLLRDDRTPHTPQSLARKTRFPAAILQEAIARLLDTGWLELIDFKDNDLQNPPQDDAASPQDAAPRARAGKGREGKGTEGKGTEQGEESHPPADAKYSAEFRTLKAALNGNGEGFTYQEFVVLFHGSRQGMVPAEVITELCALVKHEPANRWNQYGVVKCLGWMLDDISKRYRIERKDHGSDPGKRRAEKLGREYAEPPRPPPVIRI